ncbi:MAG: PduL/EutD family phosphate acyltransferase, partial [bacterium]
MENSELRSEIKKIVLKMRSENKTALIPIEASGRHVHLSQNDVEKLFGSGYQLSQKRELSQPGQFLAAEKIRLIGPRQVINNVAILGPARGSTQIELSKTDAVNLGVEAPLRLSGNTEDSAPLFIASQKEVIKVKEGAIIAKRHI